MDNNYEYYFNKIMEIIKKRRTAKQSGLMFSHEEKQEMIFNLYNNIEFLVKTVKDEQVAKIIIPTIIVNLSNDSYEEKIAEDILSNLNKKFVKNKDNFSISHKILDFVTKREDLEKAYIDFKTNNLKDTELLDSLISNAGVIKENGAYLLKDNISKEEYDKINLNIMYVEELEEKMKKYRFILEESLGYFSRKF